VHLFPPQVARQLALSLYLTRRYAEAFCWSAWLGRVLQPPSGDSAEALVSVVAAQVEDETSSAMVSGLVCSCCPRVIALRRII